jgi:uncharacterized protein
MTGTRGAPLLLLALTAGCATPPSSFYVLTPIQAAAGRTSGLDGGRLTIGLGPVTFPQFLDRPQIVAREGTNRLALDELHRWGGSLQDDFLRVWSENLATLLETSRILVYPFEVRLPPDFRILATVLRFEGTPSREAVLKVRWVVLDGQRDQILAVREDRYQSPAQAGGGEESLVAAMSDCLGAFSRDVADVVRALPKPVPLAGAVEAL